MLRQILQRGLIVGLLFLSLTPLVYAGENSSGEPVSRGIVLTIVAIDPKTNKVVDAIDSGSTNGHRLIISPDGQRLYTALGWTAVAQVLIATAPERAQPQG